VIVSLGGSETGVGGKLEEIEAVEELDPED
jgi:hypothetical protein